MAPIRFGIIGCGNWMRMSHIKQLLELPDAEIVALADPSDDSIATTRETFPDLRDTPAFADHREMLATAKPDAVAIATPHTLHMEHSLDAFDSGCHVLLEKPMVTSVAEARQLLAKRDELGKELMVSYQRHYLPEYQYVAEAIARGDIGEIEYVAALQSQAWLGGTAGSWRQDPEFSGGGQLIDSGSHLIDIVMYAVNQEVASVMAYLTNLSTPVNINSAIALRFEGGAMGTISVVGNGPRGMWEDVSFYGSKGTILLRTPAIEKVRRTLVTHENHETGEVAVQMPEGSTPDQNFIDVILGRAALKAPGEAGLRVIQVTEAAARSARSGREETPG